MNTLAGEMPRVPSTYGEVMRHKFEKQTELDFLSLGLNPFTLLAKSV